MRVNKHRKFGLMQIPRRGILYQQRRVWSRWNL